MTEQNNFPSEEPDPFEDRIGILTEELALAIQWNRPSLLWVVYDSSYARADSISMLENFLIDQGQKIAWIHAGDQMKKGVNSWRTIFEAAGNTIFFVDGLGENENVYSLLDQHKGMFTEHCVRVVFWLTRKEVTALVHLAPEFWVGRHRLIEIVTTPKPEQILQRALEFAWQGMSEYTDQFEDTNAKVSLQKSLLTELPGNSESTAIRARLLLTLGVLNWRKCDYEKADEFLCDAMKIAVSMHDNWLEAECFNALALVKSSLGRTDEAIDSYKQAIKLAPDQIFAWNNLGNLCLKINRNDEALIAFQKAIEHNPSDPIAWIGMGDVYSRIEYVNDAIASYRKAIRFAPLLPHAWNGLGEAHASIGQTNEAISAFQKAIELNPQFITPWLRLADLYNTQGHLREAVKTYQQTLTIDPKNSSIWNELGCVYLKAAKYQDASDSFLKAIELDRGFGKAYSNLGLLHANQGKYNDSIPLYLKSLELLTNDHDKHLVWDRLANAYRGLNDYDNAIKAYQMADSLNRDSSRMNNLASDNPQVDSVSEADSAPETEASQPEERSDRYPDEEQKTESNSTHDEEAPYWIFPSSHPLEDSVLINPRMTEVQAGSANLLSSVVVSTNDTGTQKIGGLSMQMALPLLSNTFSKAKPVMKEEFFDVEKPRLDSTNARVWNEKGNVHFRAGAYEEAVTAYDKAIELDRSFGWAYCNLGITYLLQGKFAEAILLLQKSLELLSNGRDQAVAWNSLGNLYRYLNDYDNAVVAYQKADELDPEHSGVRDTVEYFHAEPNTRNSRVWNELGDLFFKSGSYTEASSCYEKAIEMEPLSGVSHSNLALCLTYEAKFKKAIPLYLRSIELFQDDKDKAISWNRLGNVYRRLNDYDNAITAYQNAVKLNSEQMTLVTRARFSLLSNCFVD